MHVHLLLFQKKGWLYLLALLFSTSFSSQSQTIVKFAASRGDFGFGGDGGPAINARIWNPINLTFDNSGNLYIADQLNNRIRKVSPSGIITTVAGTGKGFSGDGGPATSAALNNPYAVVVDASGNLFIADHGNHRIRKVSTSGIISTIAGTGVADFQGDGGPALSARLFYPSGLTLAADGTLYFADQSNNRIRKIAPNGIISTITTASAPTDVELDNAGNLYFVERGNHRIRKVTTSGIVSTVVGNGTAGFSGDGGVATSAMLNNPRGLALAQDGSIYIADELNNRIRKVNPSGFISTIAGSGIAANSFLNAPSDVALDASGNFYIADQKNNMILKSVAPTVNLSNPICRQANSFELFYTSTVISADQYTVTGAGISPNQTGTAPGTSGSVTVSFDPATFTGNFTFTLSSNLTGFSADPVNGTVSADLAPTSFAVTGGGSFCAGDPAGAIGLVSSQTGVNYQLFAGATTVGSPLVGTGSAISFGSVTQAKTYTVIGTSATGCRTTMTDSAKIDSAFVANLTKTNDLSSGVSTATLTATPTNSQVYSYLFTGPGVVSQNPTSNVATVNSTGSYTVKVSRSQGCFATATVFVENAKLINTIAGNGISGFSGDAGPASAARLQSPYGVAVDGSGNVYIADQFNHRIRKVSPGGTISTVAGSGTAGFSGDGGSATSANLSAPANVALDGAGNLYIADRDNHRIRKVSTDGIISTVVGNGMAGYGGDGGAATSAKLSSPTGVDIDGSGSIYIADRDNHRIRKVSPGGTISTVAGNGTAGSDNGLGTATNASLYSPTDVAVDGAGTFYIADRDNRRVRKVTASGTISTVAGNGTTVFNGDGGAATSAGLDSPSGVAIDNEGNLLIADSGHHRIRKVNASGVISTVAGSGSYGFTGDGGVATDASLAFPSGIAVDGSGNIFIADTDNHRIRKVGAPFPSVISVKSGNWEDPTTWNVNRVPVAGDQVTLDAGHTVTIVGTEMALTLDYRPNAQLVFSGTSSMLALGQ